MDSRSRISSSSNQQKLNQPQLQMRTSKKRSSKPTGYFWYLHPYTPLAMKGTEVPAGLLDVLLWAQNLGGRSDTRTSAPCCHHLSDTHGLLVKFNSYSNSWLSTEIKTWNIPLIRNKLYSWIWEYINKEINKENCKKKKIVSLLEAYLETLLDCCSRGGESSLLTAAHMVSSEDMRYTTQSNNTEQNLCNI